MKVLVFMGDPGMYVTTGIHIDLILQEYAKGNQIFVLVCDHTDGICVRNPLMNRAYCKGCTFQCKLNMKHYLPDDIEVHCLSEYTSKIDISQLPKFSYNTSKGLRNLTYEGVDLGFGVMSTYISNTRNLYPKINDESRKYFDVMLEKEVITLKVLEQLQAEQHFGLVVFQNGRGAQLKPFLNFCQREHIDFWCTEFIRRPTGERFINNFWCNIPHDIGYHTRNMQKAWDNSHLSEEEKISIGKSFFENRRNALYAGDKIFAKDQKQGQMPADWNPNVENIVIFNSSEDEFCAVSHEIDQESVFESQIEGIKAIVEHYLDDETKHFTLRVHPNLKDIPFKYHQDLYKLNYKNLTVIPGNSSISSYSLMDAADKIIVFGSTMGVESAYWGKPAICLAGTFYRDLHIVHKPANPDELWTMIDNKSLPCLKNDKIYLYGFMIMNQEHLKAQNIDLNYTIKNIGDWEFGMPNWGTILGSRVLYTCVGKAFEFIKKHTPWWAKFRTVPVEEE